MRKRVIVLIVLFVLVIIGYIIKGTQKKELSEFLMDSSAQKMNIPKKSQTIFKNATKKYVGIKIEPIALLGKKDNEYAFLCKNTTKENKIFTWKVIIIREKNKMGEVLNVADIDINNYLTDELYNTDIKKDEGWKIYGKSGVQKKFELKEDFNKLGLDDFIYEPIAILGTKEKDGLNSVILCLCESKNNDNTYFLKVVVMNKNKEKVSLINIKDFKLEDFTK